MGFGTDAKGVESFIASGSLLGDLGSQFVAGWVGECSCHRRRGQRLRLRAGLHRGAARLLFALSRDEVGPLLRSAPSPEDRRPALHGCRRYRRVRHPALGWFAFGVAPSTSPWASGTIGTLILLLVYALATIEPRSCTSSPASGQVAAWEIVVPFLALVVIGYTLFRNVYPYPTEAARW